MQEEHFGRKQNHDITGYNILPYGYCTYRNRSDGIDFTFNINKCCKMGIISKFYPVFYGNKNNINLISIILNNSKEVAREIGYTCSGTGQKVLSFLDLQKMNIIIPNRSEQDKISDLFDNLDNLITLHQRKQNSFNLYKTFIKFNFIIINKNAWEQRKLNELLTQRVEHQTISSDAPLLAFSYAEGVINPEDKKTNKRDFIMIDKYNKVFSRTEMNDIIYNPANVIHGAIHRNRLGTGVVSPIYKIFKCNENVSPRYMGERLHTDKFISEIVKYIEGTVIKLRTLAPEKFVEMEIEIPKNIEEQELIGKTFEQIDNLITLHHRKYITFFYSWEQRKVSELFKITRGYVLATTQTSSSWSKERPYPVYSSQTKDNGLMGYYSEYLYEDAITWTTDGANAGTVNYRAGKFYCTNVCGVLLSDKIKANKMLSESLNNVAKGYVSYVGNPKLMNNVMADIEINISKNECERNKISDLFDNLDNLITLHQHKELKRRNDKNEHLRW